MRKRRGGTAKQAALSWTTNAGPPESLSQPAVLFFGSIFWINPEIGFAESHSIIPSEGTCCFRESFDANISEAELQLGQYHKEFTYLPSVSRQCCARLLGGIEILTSKCYIVAPEGSRLKENNDLSTNKILRQEFDRLLFVQITAVAFFAILLLLVFSAFQRWHTLTDSVVVSSNIVSKSLEIQDWDLIEHHIEYLTTASLLEKVKLSGAPSVGPLIGPVGLPKFGIGSICTSALVPRHPFQIEACTKLIGSEQVTYLFVFLPLYFAACWSICSAFRNRIRRTLSHLQQEIDELARTVCDGNQPLLEMQSRLPEFKQIRAKLVSLVHSAQNAAQDRSLALAGAQISHDLRGPLSAMSVGLDNIKNNPEKSIALIEGAFKVLRGLSNEMRNQYLSNHNVGPKKRRAEKCDLVSHVTDFIEQKRLAHGANVKIHSIIPMKNAFASIDPLVFQRILDNLFNNAIDAVRSQAKPEVSFEICDDQASYFVVRATDKGRGISREHLHRIFENGFTFGKKDGTGIGLGFVKSAIERAAGRISVSSLPNVATSFTLEIPKAEQSS